MNMTKMDFDKFWPEVLKMRIVLYAGYDNMPGFSGLVTY